MLTPSKSLNPIKSYLKNDIEITNELTKNLIKDLRNGYVDFLVTNLLMKEYNDLDIKICTKIHDFVPCSEKYLKNRKEKMSLQELLKYKIIL